MSNFHATTGRTVQYIGEDGIKVQAAIVTKVAGGVNLTVFKADGTTAHVTNATEYVDTFEARKYPQPNTFRLHWQDR